MQAVKAASAAIAAVEAASQVVAGLVAKPEKIFCYSHLRTCVLPHTPTDGMARIFPPTPLPKPRIKLKSVPFHLSFEGALFRTLYQLRYLI